MSIDSEDDLAALQRVGNVVARALADMEQAVEPGWTLRSENGVLAAHFEETIVITRGAPLVLTRI
jgi:methionine aminopeptidase